MLNFIGGGMMGDFIQSLYVVKNICKRDGVKANLFISDGYHGDVWTFGVEKAYKDLFDLIMQQGYINKFEMLPTVFNEPYINLNLWRNDVATTHATTGTYNKCWSEVLSEHYKFDIPAEYKWLTVKNDPQTEGKFLIHRSVHRHNGAFNWSEITQSGLQFLFLTTNQKEWDAFEFKADNVKLYLVETIGDIASAISGCEYFIGNQSSPFSIACALDVNRLVELDYDPSRFYMDETKYSNKIKWFLNNECNNR